jgi:isochorismate synthase
MQLFSDAYRLYAGGGLLTDSDEEQEWQETETKLDTMRRILKTQ